MILSKGNLILYRFLSEFCQFLVADREENPPNFTRKMWNHDTYLQVIDKNCSLAFFLFLEIFLDEWHNCYSYDTLMAIFFYFFKSWF